MLNNSFVLRMADQFAAHIDATAEASDLARSRKVYRLALGRLPNENESRLSVAFVQNHGLAALCRVIFNSNEFLYLD